MRFAAGSKLGEHNQGCGTKVASWILRMLPKYYRMSVSLMGPEEVRAVVTIVSGDSSPSAETSDAGDKRFAG